MDKKLKKEKVKKLMYFFSDISKDILIISLFFSENTSISNITEQTRRMSEDKAKDKMADTSLGAIPKISHSRASSKEKSVTSSEVKKKDTSYSKESQVKSSEVKVEECGDDVVKGAAGLTTNSSQGIE